MSNEPAPPCKPIRLHLSPRRVTRWLVIATVALLVAHVLVIGATILLDRPSLFGVARLFDLNEEQNIPAYYSALLLLTAALSLGTVTLHERAERSRWWRHWAVLAAGFAYLSLDEAASIHEKFNRPMQRLLGDSADKSDWVYAAAVAVAVVGLLYVRFLLSLPRRYRIAFVVAGLIYVGSTVGLEHVDLVGPMHVFQNDGRYDWPGLLQVTLEEGGEMAGVVLFIHFVLDYLRATGTAVLLGFGAVSWAEQDGCMTRLR